MSILFKSIGDFLHVSTPHSWTGQYEVQHSIDLESQSSKSRYTSKYVLITSNSYVKVTAPISTLFHNGSVGVVENEVLHGEDDDGADV